MILILFYFFFPQQLNTTIKVTMDVFFYACNGCLSNKVTGSESQASLFTPFCLLVIYPFPRALSFTQIVLYSYTIPGHSAVRGKQKLLAKLWEEKVIYRIFYNSPSYPCSPVHTHNHTYRQVYQHLCRCGTNILPFGCSPLLKVAN